MNNKISLKSGLVALSLFCTTLAAFATTHKAPANVEPANNVVALESKATPKTHKLAIGSSSKIAISPKAGNKASVKVEDKKTPPKKHE